MFYDNLKSVCDERGLKITNLVKELGISSGNMSRWKNGTVPKGNTLAALATRLEVSVDDLIYGKERKPTANEGNELSEKEIKFLSIINQLPPDKFELVENLAKTLLNNQ